MNPRPRNRQMLVYIEAAKNLGLRYRILHRAGLAEFRKKGKVVRTFRASTQANHAVSILLSKNKFQTNRLLSQAGLPVPIQYWGRSRKDALKAAKAIGFPVVVKPTLGLMGEDAIPNITSTDELQEAIRRVRHHHQSFVVEKHHPGEDFRLLVLENRVIGAVKRVPPRLIGDGKHTINALAKKLPNLRIDNEVKRVLAKQGLGLDQVLGKGKRVALRYNANFSTGGKTVAIDPQEMHHKLRLLAVKAAKVLGLTLAGVDLLIKDHRQPVQRNAVIIEVNAQPGVYIHHRPDRGTPQPVAETILRYLFHL